jgi:hypothetical protein
MAANRQRVIERRNKVRAEFQKLTALKKYKYDFIINKLADQFHYQPKTIENIIISTDEDANKSQLKLEI